jgi:exodeoxyribonuclease VII small subunit
MNEPAEPLTFEKALAELEWIVRDLEEGRSGLEDSLAQYEAGVSLLKRCHDQLRQAEQRIALLTGMDGEGKPITRPFAHEASAEKSVAQPAPAAKPTAAAPVAPAPAAPPPRPGPEPRAPARETPAEPPGKPRPAGGLLWE